MKALVISPQPFFSPRGTPFSVYYRTLVTAESGVEVDLLTYGQGQDVVIPGVNIIRIPSISKKEVPVGPSIHKLFLDLFIFLWTMLLLIKNRYNFVHAHEESVFFCIFLKPIFRFNLVYDMHSSLPQQLSNFNFTKSKFLIWLFDKLEQYALRQSEAIITICPDLKEYADSLLKGSDKNYLIENSIFDPVNLKSGNSPEIKIPENESIALLKAQKISEENRLIVYAGTLEPYQGIDILLNSFKEVVETTPEAFLIIAGGTDLQRSNYSLLADSLTVSDNCLFTGRVTQSTAQKLCSYANVLVSPRTYGTNTPLKIYEQLASGIPVVATNIYSHTQVLNNDVAILVNPDSSDMARGINEAIDGSQRISRILKNAEALYRKKYSRSAYETKLKTLIERIS